MLLRQAVLHPVVLGVDISSQPDMQAVFRYDATGNLIFVPAECLLPEADD
jgi:hypothetical protein